MQVETRAGKAAGGRTGVEVIVGALREGPKRYAELQDVMEVAGLSRLSVQGAVQRAKDTGQGIISHKGEYSLSSS